MNSAEPFVISTQGLSKTYQGVNALQPLDLHVAHHSIFGFLVPNAAGKSTTIKLLPGLARPSAGSAAIRERIGYLAQDPRYYDRLSACETPQFTARFFCKGLARALEKRIAETLDLVGLADKVGRPIKGFSGGERQRLGTLFDGFVPPDLVLPWTLGEF